MRTAATAAVLAALLLGASLAGWPQRKKDREKEPVTETLELPPELPSAVVGETSRLVFHVAPITTQGLLSRQIRDSLKALFRASRRDRILKLRAFVAGSGDLRRVQDVVAETFADRKLPLPALSVVQVGTLPAVGAQVLLEAVAESRKVVNPHGIAFISGQVAASAEPTLHVAPLVGESLAKVRTAVDSLGAAPADVLRLTCYCSSLDDGPAIYQRMFETFRTAALAYMQLRREYTRGSVECEAVVRLPRPAGEPVRFLNPDGLERVPHRSQIALISAERVVLTGTQMAFRHQDADVRLAFERLGKVLAESGTSYERVVQASFYPISMALAEKIWTLGFEFIDKNRPPASTMAEFEGLPSLDASFAVDVVAARLPEGRSGT
jgi:enamine deaminase RidA (YjgF/YER057c/UK114 family)